MRFPVRIMTLSALFAVLTALGAFIRIPFPLVPITLQTFFVFLSGTLLGSRAGALAQVLYVGMGLIGLPVFTGGGGSPVHSPSHLRLSAGLYRRGLDHRFHIRKVRGALLRPVPDGVPHWDRRDLHRWGICPLSES